LKQSMFPGTAESHSVVSPFDMGTTARRRQKPPPSCLKNWWFLITAMSSVSVVPSLSLEVSIFPSNQSDKLPNAQGLEAEGNVNFPRSLQLSVNSTPLEPVSLYGLKRTWPSPPRTSHRLPHTFPPCALTRTVTTGSPGQSLLRSSCPTQLP
jgi:hypothetical protein